MMFVYKIALINYINEMFSKHKKKKQEKSILQKG